jgi:hypothetical protein
MSIMNDRAIGRLMDRIRDGIKSDGIVLEELHVALSQAYKEGRKHAAEDIARTCRGHILE